MDRIKHNENVRAQFSKQAAGYTSIKAHADALNLIIEMSDVMSDDNVLDIACGSGIVSCEFARYTNHVTGVDITESMLEQARMQQTKNALTNVDWVLDDVVPLNFDDNQFSIVVTRFSFHHFMDYEKALEEMIRVCKPAGRVVVVDVALPAEKIDAYDRMEKLRDPSHVGALSVDKFEELFYNNNRFSGCQKWSYKMAIDLETQLNASFPNPGDRAVLSTMIKNDVGVNNLGVDVQEVNDRYQLFYPIYIYVGIKK